MKNKKDRLPEPLQQLADAIEAKGLKMTFGLTPAHIERIKQYRFQWNNKAELLQSELSRIDDHFIDLGIPDVIYTHHMWQELGKEFGWDALTLALYYFKRLSKNDKSWLKK